MVSPPQPESSATEPVHPQIAGRIGGASPPARLRSLTDAETLKALVGNLREGVYVTNLQGEILDANTAFLDMLGVTSLAELSRINAFDIFVDPEQRVRELELLRQDGAVREFEIEIRRPDGGRRTVLDSCTSVRDIDSEELLFHGVLVDITERKLSERAREESQASLERSTAELQRALSLLSTTLESTADGILVIDASGRVETCNRKFLEMWRLPEELVGTTDQDGLVGVMAEQLKDGDATQRRVKELETNPELETYDEIELKDGRVFERYSIPQRQGGTIMGRVWSYRDVTARKSAEMRLVHDAFHDALTNLPNRALFTDLLARSIGRAKRRDDYAFALLFLDIDRFKVVNDSLGHLIGDHLLVAIARRLERCLRPGDTVARLGGDEFTVLLDDIIDVSDATRIADRIQRELNLPFNLSGQEVFTSASIGIALSTSNYERPDDLLRDADIAMYRAKALGKQRYEVFDSAMHAKAVSQLQLETDLRRALDREEFRIHYQPIFSLISGKVLGFEALVRWQHPQRGTILPDEFVQVAEETGLIVLIGRVVLREACRQLREWQVQFPHQTLTISVNISAKQFRQPDLVDHISRVLTAWDLDPRSLRLEITESAIIENAPAAIEALARLRALGILVDLDDFGTGYSSLGYLHRFDIDALKIDRSFVSNIGEGGENSEIVRTIVNLARGLDMDVIAEGVERPEQLAILRSLGCEKVQGFLFSPPLATESVRALLKARV
ncbi:MAG TPA: EAL domain-containing protein [Gemmatimonadales bacterium]|jgi:diguanylate cyclase (GGDEF)-like protein/PAS domain S-box-containing protein